jgi:hypothetical protein
MLMVATRPPGAALAEKQMATANIVKPNFKRIFVSRKRWLDVHAHTDSAAQ